MSSKVKKNASAKTVKNSEDKFFTEFKQKCIDRNYNKIPLVFILNTEPKPGLPWSSYYQVQAQYDPNDVIKIHIGYEGFEKDGLLKRLYIKNQNVSENLLIMLHDSFDKYRSISVLKLEYCNLTDQEIIVLESIIAGYPTITDLSIDGNPNSFQNHFIVLRSGTVRHASFKRCQLNNFAMKQLQLELNTNANCLTILNLTGNYIDDIALEPLVEMLRFNRTIMYLSLADNWISDRGCALLMSAFQEFELNRSELRIRREVNIMYFLRKKQLMEQLKEDSMRSFSFLKSQRKNSSKFLVREKSKSATSSKMSALSESERIENYLKKSLPKQDHPFVKNCLAQNFKVICPGNFKLTYLNLAYNNITAVGCKDIIDCLKYQLEDEVWKSGLMYLVLDGNRMKDDSELKEINTLLEEQKWKLVNKGSKKSFGKI